jgi:hypothetical protein
MGLMCRHQGEEARTLRGMVANMQQFVVVILVSSFQVESSLVLSPPPRFDNTFQIFNPQVRKHPKRSL